MSKRSHLVSSFLLAFASLAVLCAPGLAQQSSDEPTQDDFAGIWKASEGVLYTTPADQSGVLAALGAQPAGESTWTASTYNVDGTLTQASFTVTLLDPASLISLFPSPGDPIPCPHPNHVLYRNSVCGTQHFGVSFLCQAQAGGTSFRSESNTYKSCRRQAGGGYCVDVKSVVGWILYYDSSDCSGPVINTIFQYGGACR
jgi:hypothetical protein